MFKKSEQKAPQVVKYEPAGKVSQKFLEDPSFVRGIMGPIGSGKSTACAIEILRRAQMQTPSADNVRRTRWAIIRNSYPELKTTTLKTWGDWCPTRYGRLTMDSPILHHVKVPPGEDGTPGLDMEVLFLALDREDDARKLLSLELTGAWVNEAREVPKGIIDALTGRVGRYPSKSQGGASWSGIVMDTNPPDDQSWWYKYAEEETPEGWKFFKQPSGDSKQAENVKNLPTDYYKRIRAGKDPDWVKVYVDGEYGFVTEGKAVYPMYRDRVHASPTALQPVERLPLLIGVDFGLTPAAVIGQRLTSGRWLILDEFVTENCGVIRFAENLKLHIARHYPEFQVGAGWGDPAGTARHADERTSFEIMKTYTGWMWRPAPGENDPVMRLEVVKAALNRLVDGEPGLLISPKAVTIRKGFAGGYHYKFMKTLSGTRVFEQPAKNAFSHPHDALQYLLLGEGEHDVVLGKTNRRHSRKNRQTVALGLTDKIFD